VTRKKKSKGGRPRVVIDVEQLEQLAAINCSLAEMAAVMKCDQRTLTRRFAQAIEKGKLRGTSSLKKAQFSLAVNGKNATMQIWLGKQLLGQRDQRDAPVGDPQSLARGVREMVGALFAVQQ